MYKELAWLSGQNIELFYQWVRISSSTAYVNMQAAYLLGLVRSLSKVHTSTCFSNNLSCYSTVHHYLLLQAGIYEDFLELSLLGSRFFVQIKQVLERIQLGLCIAGSSGYWVQQADQNKSQDFGGD